MARRGYLVKRGSEESFFQRNNRKIRWFVLDGSCFAYYKNKKSA